MTRCLLVDDDEFDRLLFIRRMETAAPDWDIDAAPCLSDALERLQQARYDVVVTDLLLPDGEGADVVSAITSAAGSAPVIVLSGMDRHPETGAAAVLNKNGFRPEQLLELLA